MSDERRERYTNAIRMHEPAERTRILALLRSEEAVEVARKASKNSISYAGDPDEWFAKAGEAALAAVAELIEREPR